MTDARFIKQAPYFQLWGGRKDDYKRQSYLSSKFFYFLSPQRLPWTWKNVSWTYKSLILNRRSPLISHSIDGYVLGWHWAGQYHYIAFIHRIAITLQLCNEACVFCIFKEFPHFPIILIAWRDIMLLLATFAVAAYFPEIHRNSNKITISHHLGVQSPGTQTAFFSAFFRKYTFFCSMSNTSLYVLLHYLYCLFTDLVIRSISVDYSNAFLTRSYVISSVTSHILRYISILSQTHTYPLSVTYQIHNNLMHQQDSLSNHLLRLLVFQLVFIHSKLHTLYYFLHMYFTVCMIFGYHWIAIMWKQVFPKKEENAYRHTKSVIALSSIQSTAFKEKMKEKLKAYMDKAFQNSSEPSQRYSGTCCREKFHQKQP